MPEPRATTDARPDSRTSTTGRAEPSGISNRESPAEEAAERGEHPPLNTDSPEPMDAAGRTGEDPLGDISGRQTSHKAGSRSIAQKASESRYPESSMPPTRAVAGAFGREPVAPLEPSPSEPEGDERPDDVEE